MTYLTRVSRLTKRDDREFPKIPEFAGVQSSGMLGHHDDSPHWQ